MGTGATVSSETRAAHRREAMLVTNITAVRIMPHRAEAKLINISTTGMLVECATRLQPGSSCTVIIEGGFTPDSIDSRVARSAVIAVTKEGGIRYHIGFSFKQPIVLEELAVAPAPVPEAPIVELEPVRPAATTSTLRNRW